MWVEVTKIRYDGEEIVGRLITNPFGDIDLFVVAGDVPSIGFSKLIGSGRLVAICTRAQVVEWCRDTLEKLR